MQSRQPSYSVVDGVNYEDGKCPMSEDEEIQMMARCYTSDDPNWKHIFSTDNFMTSDRKLKKRLIDTIK